MVRILVWLLLGVAVCGACAGAERPAIAIEERTVMVENQTPRQWSNVEVWVNDHYRATAPVLAPGARLAIPLGSFVAGFGQRFDPGQVVRGVEVVATSPSGEDVRIVWGHGRRR